MIVQSYHLGLVVRRSISANPGLNLYPGFRISLFKCLFGIIISFPFGASDNHILDKENQTEFSLTALDLKPDFTLTLGYLNPASNNPALGVRSPEQVEPSYQDDQTTPLNLGAKAVGKFMLKVYKI